MFDKCFVLDGGLGLGLGVFLNLGDVLLGLCGGDVGFRRDEFWVLEMGGDFTGWWIGF